MSKATEKELDEALDKAFKDSHEFTIWFLSKTKFAEISAQYYWSRSDNPWGRVPSEEPDPETGKLEKIIRESETDVLVVFEAEGNKRFALHIENKLGNGKFTLGQPRNYTVRAKHWAGNPKYGNYTEFETVLVAPKEFYERNIEEARIFDRFISHEEIASFIPIFLP